MKTFYFMRQKSVDLLKYLPPFLGKDPTFRDVEDTLSREHENLRVKLADLAAQFFVETATWSIGDWENFVGVAKTSDNLEARRARVKAKLLGGEVMTAENVNKLIHTFTDGELSHIEETDLPNQIRVILRDRVFNWQGLMDSLAELLPAHLSFQISRPYASHIDLYAAVARNIGGRKIFSMPNPQQELASSTVNVATATVKIGRKTFTFDADSQLDLAPATVNIATGIVKIGRKTFAFDANDI